MDKVTSLGAVALASFALSYIGSSVGLMLGHLRLPLLVQWIGSPVAGAGTNLAVSAVGALSGFYEHARRKQVDYRLVAVIGIPSAAASFFIARFFAHSSPLWLRALMAIVLVLSGLDLIFRQKDRASERKIYSNRMRLVIESATGILLGALAGAVGLMMGGARLCSLIRFLQIEPRVAVGTNLAVGGLTGILGALGAWSGSEFNTPAFAAVGLATVIGAHYGAKATEMFHPRLIARLAGVAITISGVYIVSYA